MPFWICSSRRFPVQCAVTRHTGPFLRLPAGPLYWCVWLLTPLLLLSSGSAYAEWVSIGSSEGAGGTAVYVDPDTIRRKGDLVKMWTMFDFKAVQIAENFAYLSYRMQKQFDCSNEQVQPLMAAYFSGNMETANVVFAKTGEGMWQPVAPGSVGQVLWDLVCGKE